jgi:hypothetical protein
MASSLVIVANLALSHIGHAVEIAALDERSAEARACNRFMEQARDSMLRDFVWPFATKNAGLNLVTSSSDDNHPTREWVYSYRYPSDCLFFRRIESGVRNDSRFTEVPYRLAADSQGTLIYTDKQEAYGEYTSTDGQNPARWHSDFELALSYRLGYYVAPRVIRNASAGEILKIQSAMWRASVARAQANAGNEEKPDIEPDGELVLARS